MLAGGRSQTVESQSWLAVTQLTLCASMELVMYLERRAGPRAAARALGNHQSRRPILGEHLSVRKKIPGNAGSTFPYRVSLRRYGYVHHPRNLYLNQCARLRLPLLTPSVHLGVSSLILLGVSVSRPNRTLIRPIPKGRPPHARCSCRACASSMRPRPPATLRRLQAPQWSAR